MSPASPTTFEILAPGLLTTVQDLGRRGHAHLGVPTSGAVDEAAFRLANRLVGNSADAACLETTLGGAAVLFHGAASVAITGAPAPTWLDKRPVAFAERVYVKAGQTLRLGTPDYGLRTYLGVNGGIDLPPILGSRSTDTLSGLGPEPLAPGMVLPIRAHPRSLDSLGCPDVATSAVPTTLDPTVRVHSGLREDWFTPDALGTLTSASWEVTAETNRVGARLSGPRLNHSTSTQLPSEGMVRGAIEIPPSGQPIVFLADHPTIGGYPVIAVVHAADLALLAQARPGTRLRFAIARQTLAGP